MSEVEAIVAAKDGGKYVRQLCKHWAHKLPVEIEGEGASPRGVVTFVGAVATLDADDAGIRVHLSGNDRENLDRLKDVVAQHIDRFAFREAPLAYDWTWAD
ncbi:hypothetical protein B2G71_07970 [Novosphingobium sp. PC22D]|uniref:DUF2218 domain-containing protein n=1 Tax=Novosphingobium sp. PC22D TaxID=1962403 RepID=UPI000BF09644|nr:DUF2218 domain-containing protein [Novosphingobium sp. PC22D]PEQ13359.1 hypothetical protein B2G71_07970 [Novosphingobium sp. PC22D]